MNLGSDKELANTKRELQFLETSYDEVRTGPDEDEHIRELEMESLKRLINQLKEETARYEAHQPTRR